MPFHHLPARGLATPNSCHCGKSRPLCGQVSAGRHSHSAGRARAKFSLPRVTKSKDGLRHLRQLPLPLVRPRNLVPQCISRSDQRVSRRVRAGARLKLVPVPTPSPVRRHSQTNRFPRPQPTHKTLRQEQETGQVSIWPPSLLTAHACAPANCLVQPLRDRTTRNERHPHLTAARLPWDRCLRQPGSCHRHRQDTTRVSIGRSRYRTHTQGRLLHSLRSCSPHEQQSPRAA